MDLFKGCMKVKSDKRMFLAGLLLLMAIFTGIKSEQNSVTKNFSRTFHNSRLQLPIQPFPQSENFQKSISTTTNQQSKSFGISVTLPQPHRDYNFFPLLKTQRKLHKPLVRRQIPILLYDIPTDLTQEIHQSLRAFDLNFVDIFTTSLQPVRPISHILCNINFSKTFIARNLFHTKWHIYKNFELQFGGKRSRIFHFDADLKETLINSFQYDHPAQSLYHHPVLSAHHVHSIHPTISVQVLFHYLDTGHRLK